MFEKKEQDKLSQYEDPIGGFSSRDLRLATWYVRHKDQLRAIFVLCFIVFDVVLLGYALWGWGYYAVFGYRQDRDMMNRQLYEIADYASLQSRYAAQPLKYGVPEVFESGDGVYDFVINVQHDNADWIATVNYVFAYSGTSTPVQQATLMPGARQPIAALGIQASGSPRGAQFQVLGVSWKRISVHDVSDPQDHLEKRNQFRVDNVNFAFAEEADTGGHRVTFDITNDSVFSYWTPTFLVELKDGNNREGVVRITLDEFLAGETRPVSLQRFSDNLYVSDIAVYPEINFFSETEFIE